uniref:Signal peptidase I n=1 Tax=uncultured bacterium Contigcl_1764b TaxID=1393658 RepID=W0FT11_9BACT|nr:signal peptidase I [uncultured bacterium Contigcl_1764b]
MEIYHPRDEELLREMRRVRRSAKRKRLTWGLLILLVLSIAAGLFVFNRYYRFAVMHGVAMGDTLPAGSLVLVRRANEGKSYASGDIILYEKRIASPIEFTILSPKGKIRESCQYIIYRDMGTTRQYFSVGENGAAWVTDSGKAEVYVTDGEGTLRLETDDLPNGEYWAKEVKASYGQDVLKDPIPFNVNNPVRTQIKRVLAATGDRIVLSPYAETLVNGQEIDRTRTSGRTADANVTARRININRKEYFVSGDQLSLSVDSRDADYDMVSEDDVLGRAEFVIWPVRCFGELTGQTASVSAGSRQGGAE